MRTAMPIRFEVRQERCVPPADVRVAPASVAADRLEPAMWNTAESELLTRVASGDVDAFSEVYDRFADPMFSLAMRILRDGSAAEDAVQEAFVQIWEKASTYNPALGKPMTWAVTLARNRAIERLRSSVRREKLAAALANETEWGEPTLAGTDDAIMGNETARQVRAALAQVPVEQRQAIEMAYFGGLTQTEIATALNVPLGTVKARIRRGMLLMRDLLDVH
ncbi:MAG: sigma-70 family RNA polymerase sigma factor [Verrucomicrobiales bacterium]|nr:sigma-70 family RNA polymerase sigma factor [Verrucomicrobiales bacterium]